MIGMTLCSGIGAPEVAAPWMDWRMAAEIEPFPRAVLQARHGYKLPEDHNQGDPLLWGDMTEVKPELLRQRGVPLPDILVAGTPCQDFSIAGLRAGTAGDRGNLTLKFVEICHEIADARPDGKLAVLWENVPGVLSDRGNAFGNFLGGIVGAVDAIPQPAGGSWPTEGMVEGPRARLAWCILDARWFGVAQRRRRVFVLVDFGNCLDPAAVLLEPDRLRGDHPPRQQAGQGSARGVEFGPSGGGFTDVAPTLDARCNDGPIRNQIGAAVFTERQGFDAGSQPWAMRRLTPTECERLQGFPDDFTAITHRNKPAADGPRYKAIGNSMAVPCIAWIMDRMRISMEEPK
jgi:DNA (cytosine-5)-methyltransferase 1